MPDIVVIYLCQKVIVQKQVRNQITIKLVKTKKLLRTLFSNILFN